MPVERPPAVSAAAALATASASRRKSTAPATLADAADAAAAAAARAAATGSKVAATPAALVAAGTTHWPLPRSGAAVEVIGDGLIMIMGGRHSGGRYQDVHILNLGTRLWAEVRTKGTSPKGRKTHSMTRVGSRLFLFGGNLGTTWGADMHIMDLSLILGEILPPSTVPVPASTLHCDLGIGLFNAVLAGMRVADAVAAAEAGHATVTVTVDEAAFAPAQGSEPLPMSLSSRRQGGPEPSFLSKAQSSSGLANSGLRSRPAAATEAHSSRLAAVGATGDHPDLTTHHASTAADNSSSNAGQASSSSAALKTQAAGPRMRLVGRQHAIAVAGSASAAAGSAGSPTDGAAAADDDESNRAAIGGGGSNSTESATVAAEAATPAGAQFDGAAAEGAIALAAVGDAGAAASVTGRKRSHAASMGAAAADGNEGLPTALVPVSTHRSTSDARSGRHLLLGANRLSSPPCIAPAAASAGPRALEPLADSPPSAARVGASNGQLPAAKRRRVGSRSGTGGVEVDEDGGYEHDGPEQDDDSADVRGQDADALAHAHADTALQPFSHAVAAAPIAEVTLADAPLRTLAAATVFSARGPWRALPVAPGCPLLYDGLGSIPRGIGRPLGRVAPLATSSAAGAAGASATVMPQSAPPAPGALAAVIATAATEAANQAQSQQSRRGGPSLAVGGLAAGAISGDESDNGGQEGFPFGSAANIAPGATPLPSGSTGIHALGARREAGACSAFTRSTLSTDISIPLGQIAPPGAAGYRGRAPADASTSAAGWSADAFLRHLAKTGDASMVAAAVIAGEPAASSAAGSSAEAESGAGAAAAMGLPRSPASLATAAREQAQAAAAGGPTGAAATLAGEVAHALVSRAETINAFMAAAVGNVGMIAGSDGSAGVGTGAGAGAGTGNDAAHAAQPRTAAIPLQLRPGEDAIELLDALTVQRRIREESAAELTAGRAFHHTAVDRGSGSSSSGNHAAMSEDIAEEAGSAAASRLMTRTHSGRRGSELFAAPPAHMQQPHAVDSAATTARSRGNASDFSSGRIGESAAESDRHVASAFKSGAVAMQPAIDRLISTRHNPPAGGWLPCTDAGDVVAAMLPPPTGLQLQLPVPHLGASTIVDLRANNASWSAGAGSGAAGHTRAVLSSSSSGGGAAAADHAGSSVIRTAQLREAAERRKLEVVAHVCNEQEAAQGWAEAIAARRAMRTMLNGGEDACSGLLLGPVTTHASTASTAAGVVQAAALSAAALQAQPLMQARLPLTQDASTDLPGTGVASSAARAAVAGAENLLHSLVQGAIAETIAATARASGAGRNSSGGAAALASQLVHEQARLEEANTAGATRPGAAPAPRLRGLLGHSGVVASRLLSAPRPLPTHLAGRAAAALAVLDHQHGQSLLARAAGNSFADTIAAAMAAPGAAGVAPATLGNTGGSSSASGAHSVEDSLASAAALGAIAASTAAAVCASHAARGVQPFAAAGGNAGTAAVAIAPAFAAALGAAASGDAASAGAFGAAAARASVQSFPVTLQPSADAMLAAAALPQSSVAPQLHRLASSSAAQSNADADTEADTDASDDVAGESRATPMQMRQCATAQMLRGDAVVLAEGKHQPQRSVHFAANEAEAQHVAVVAGHGMHGVQGEAVHGAAAAGVAAYQTLDAAHAAQQLLHASAGAAVASVLPNGAAVPMDHQRVAEHGFAPSARVAAFADVLLLVEGVAVPAHRAILAARSPYFALLLAGMEPLARTQVLPLTGEIQPAALQASSASASASAPATRTATPRNADGNSAMPAVNEPSWNSHTVGSLSMRAGGGIGLSLGLSSGAGIGVGLGSSGCADVSARAGSPVALIGADSGGGWPDHQHAQSSATLALRAEVRQAAAAMPASMLGRELAQHPSLSVASSASSQPQPQPGSYSGVIISLPDARLRAFLLALRHIYTDTLPHMAELDNIAAAGDWALHPGSGIVAACAAGGSDGAAAAAPRFAASGTAGGLGGLGASGRLTASFSSSRTGAGAGAGASAAVGASASTAFAATSLLSTPAADGRLCLELLAEAQRLQLPRLSLYVQRLLEGTLSLRNAPALLCAADALDALPLRRACMRYILTAFEPLLAGGGLVPLPGRLLREILAARAELHSALAGSRIATALGVRVSVTRRRKEGIEPLADGSMRPPLSMQLLLRQKRQQRLQRRRSLATTSRSGAGASMAVDHAGDADTENGSDGDGADADSSDEDDFALELGGSEAPTRRSGRSTPVAPDSDSDAVIVEEGNGAGAGAGAGAAAAAAAAPRHALNVDLGQSDSDSDADSSVLSSSSSSDSESSVAAASGFAAEPPYAGAL